MLGKTISQSELTLNSSLKKRGTCIPLLLVSRRSRQRRGVGGQGMSSVTKRSGVMVGETVLRYELTLQMRIVD
jgi:hypothetical protein